MKVAKKILMIVCILVIVVGMFMLGKNDLNYNEGYSRSILLETAKQYTLYVAVATVIILIYFSLRYSKQGIIKVLATSILGILGAVALVVSILAITRMGVDRFFFPIILTTYVSSIIVLTSNFEENT